MRGIVGAVCHGPERGPLEPYGVLAPLLRAGAWALVFIAAVSALTGIVAVRLAWLAVVAPSIVTSGTALALAMLVRWCAGVCRPGPISLTARDAGLRQ